MANNDLIKHLTDDNFHNEISKGVFLVDFFASWCGPCRMLTPIIEEIAKNFAGKAKVGKVDIDAEQNVAAEFQVTSVPTLILFKDGKEIGRLIGLRDMEAIKDFVSAVL
jgi:thioredoxin 1